MDEPEPIRTVEEVRFEVVDPLHPDAQHCLGEYFAELDRRFDGGFDHALSLAPDAGLFRPPDGEFLVATVRDAPVGCGGLRFKPGQPIEIKRMWIAGSARGLGVGRRLLAALEARAAGHGGRTVRLETNRALTEAIAMYRASGYREVEPFNDERYGDHWFEKDLAVASDPVP